MLKYTREKDILCKKSHLEEKQYQLCSVRILRFLHIYQVKYSYIAISNSNKELTVLKKMLNFVLNETKLLLLNHSPKEQQN